jgi:hypothetical protein
MNKLNDRITEPQEKTHLAFWTEIVGILNNYQFTNDFLQVVVDNKILTLRTVPQSKYLQELLNTILIGQKVAVLRTDIPDKPFLIHSIS